MARSIASTLKTFSDKNWIFLEACDERESINKEERKSRLEALLVSAKMEMKSVLWFSYRVCNSLSPRGIWWSNFLCGIMTSIPSFSSHNAGVDHDALYRIFGADIQLVLCIFGGEGQLRQLELSQLRGCSLVVSCAAMLAAVALIKNLWMLNWWRENTQRPLPLSTINVATSKKKLHKALQFLISMKFATPADDSVKIFLLFSIKTAALPPPLFLVLFY